MSDYKAMYHNLQKLFHFQQEDNQKLRKALETLKCLAEDSLDIEKSYNLTATDVLALVELELKEKDDE